MFPGLKLSFPVMTRECISETRKHNRDCVTNDRISATLKLSVSEISINRIKSVTHSPGHDFVTVHLVC